MNRGPYSMAAHGLDTRGDARRAEDAWDAAADERFYVRQEAAEDAWLARQDDERRSRPRLPDPWGHDNKEENR